MWGWLARVSKALARRAAQIELARSKFVVQAQTLRQKLSFIESPDEMTGNHQKKQVRYQFSF